MSIPEYRTVKFEQGQRVQRAAKNQLVTQMKAQKRLARQTEKADEAEQVVIGRRRRRVHLPSHVLALRRWHSASA